MKQALSFLFVLAFAAHAQTGSGAKRIAQKLDHIRLPEVAFDGLTLDEVAADLTSESKRLDPDGTGVTIRIQPGRTSSPSWGNNPVFDLPGQPGNRARGKEIKEIIALIRLPLFDLSLRQVLDAVTRTCDVPMTYRIEEQAVVLQIDERSRRVNKSTDGKTKTATAEIRKQLKRIKLPEVHYDGVSLDSVVLDLLEQTRRQGQPVNFVLAPPRGQVSMDHSDGGPVLDAMGNPIIYVPQSGFDTGVNDVSSFVIHLNHTLTNLSLAGALDVIVQSANRPIQYSVESFGVVFDRLSDSDQPAVTAIITVDEKQVLAKLDALSVVAPDAGRTMVSERLRAYLFAAGIGSMSEREYRSQLYFNHENGQVLVRALKDDIPKIKAVLQRMGTAKNKR